MSNENLAAQSATGQINKSACDMLASCIETYHLYATDEETAEWLKTPQGQRIQKLINEQRALRHKAAIC